MTSLNYINPSKDPSRAEARKTARRPGSARPYRYRHVTMGILLDDFRFGASALESGDLFPDFDIATTDGDRIRRSDFIDRKPLLLIFGSITCPMTASSIPQIRQLHQEYGNRIEFVMLNVREAHPGESIEQPETFDQKRCHAEQLKALHDIAWTVGIDDIDGTLHQDLDTKPNAAFLMDTGGRIAFRSLWAGDNRALGNALKRVATGQRPAKPQSTAMMAPMARGMGYFHDVLQQAGPRAGREMLLAAAPLAVVGRVAALFKQLAPHKRGPAAILGIISITAAFVGASFAALG